MKTHVIDGKTYVEVERKAEVGEKVIDLVDGGKILTIIESPYGRSKEWYSYKTENGSDIAPIGQDEYRVLEPVADEDQLTVELTANDIRWQPDRVIDLLANLARRVSSLEAEVKKCATHYAVNKVEEEVDDLAKRIQRNFNGLETQLRDTQNNVERQAEELAEIKVRTQRKNHVTNAFPSNAKLLAEAFEALAKHENGGAR